MKKTREARADSETKTRGARRSDLPALLEIYNDEVRTSPATFDLEPQTLAQGRSGSRGTEARIP